MSEYTPHMPQGSHDAGPQPVKRSDEFHLGSTYKQKDQYGDEEVFNATDDVGGFRRDQAVPVTRRWLGRRRPVPTPEAAAWLADFTARTVERSRRERAPEGWRPA